MIHLEQGWKQMKGRKIGIKTVQAIQQLSENMSVRDVAKKLKISPGAVQKYKDLELKESLTQAYDDAEIKKQLLEQYSMIQKLQKEIADLKTTRMKKSEPAQKQEIEMLVFEDAGDETYLSAKELAARLYREDGNHPPHDAVEDAWNNLYGSGEPRPHGKYPLGKFLKALEEYNKKPRTREMEYKAPKPA